MKSLLVVLLVWHAAVLEMRGAEAAAPATAEKAPTEFITQVLEPMGGKIERPKEWFYKKSTRGASYIWIMAKEDPDKGEYKTGVKIQLLSGIKAGTGKSAKEFALAFVDGKKKETGVKVVDACEPKDQGLFTRACLETEEGDFHILYSVFWGTNDMDIVVVMISGTPKELWPVYEPVFTKKMGEFELIDMKRFEAKPVLDLKKEQIVGSWHFEDEELESNSIFRADGTYWEDIVLVQDQKVLAEMEGKWSVEKGAIHYEITKSSDARVKVGTKDEDKVLEITKDSFVDQDSQGVRQKYVRALEFKKEQLVGNWRAVSGDITGVYNYKEDGTYTSTASRGAAILAQVEGTWSVADGMIYVERLKSTNENIPLGKDHDRVVEITKDYYVLKAGKDAVHKYERVK